MIQLHNIRFRGNVPRQGFWDRFPEAIDLRAGPHICKNVPEEHWEQTGRLETQPSHLKKFSGVEYNVWIYNG